MSCSPLNSITLDSPIGPLHIETCEGGIHSVRVECTVKDPEASVQGKVSLSKGKADEPSLVKCVDWFKSYFKGTIEDLNFPLCSKGISSFQQDALKAASKIKPGDSMTYAELGRKISKNGCARAVGSAMSKNRHPILLPCHRIVYSSGKPPVCNSNGYFRLALLAHEALISKSSHTRDTNDKAVLAPKFQPNSAPESNTTSTEPKVKAENESDEDTQVRTTNRKAAPEKKPAAKRSCPSKRRAAS